MIFTKRTTSLMIGGNLYLVFISFLFFLLPLSLCSRCRCALSSSKLLLQLQEQLHLRVHYTLFSLTGFDFSHLATLRSHLSLKLCNFPSIGFNCQCCGRLFCFGSASSF